MTVAEVIPPVVRKGRHVDHARAPLRTMEPDRIIPFHLTARRDNHLGALAENIAAVARPMPELPPVTIATLPSNFRRLTRNRVQGH